MLIEEIKRRDPNFSKPLLIFEQQKSPSEAEMLSKAIRETFLGLVDADKAAREPAPLSHLTLGLKCGGSDGFSGLSANPAIGHTADLVAALGGKGILSEFPELCGVEQELIDRQPGRMPNCSRGRNFLASPPRPNFWAMGKFGRNLGAESGVNP